MMNIENNQLQVFQLVLAHALNENHDELMTKEMLLV